MLPSHPDGFKGPRLEGDKREGKGIEGVWGRGGNGMGKMGRKGIKEEWVRKKKGKVWRILLTVVGKRNCDFQEMCQQNKQSVDMKL